MKLKQGVHQGIFVHLVVSSLQVPHQSIRTKERRKIMTEATENVLRGTEILDKSSLQRYDLFYKEGTMTSDLEHST
jgi:hypothetical protein